MNSGKEENYRTTSGYEMSRNKLLDCDEQGCTKAYTNSKNTVSNKATRISRSLSVPPSYTRRTDKGSKNSHTNKRKYGKNKYFIESVGVLNKSFSNDSLDIISDSFTKFVGKYSEYEDVISAYNLLVFENISDTNLHMLHKSSKLTCFNVGKLMKSKIIGKYPSCSASEQWPETSVNRKTGISSQTEETYDVFKTIDGILDIHDESENGLIHSANQKASDNDQSSIVDCLLDLDIYLDEIDGKCRSPQQRTKMIPQNLERSNGTFPLNKKFPFMNSKYTNDGMGYLKFRRDLPQRKTIGCILGRKDININGNRIETGSSISSGTPCTSWRQDSKKKVKKLLSPDVEQNFTYHGEHKVTGSSIEKCSGSVAPSNLSSEVNCSNQGSSTNESHLLTEEQIFQNILAQSGNENVTAHRPRQFGRRTEGSLHISLQESNANNNCVIIAQNHQPISVVNIDSTAFNAAIVQEENSYVLLSGSVVSTLNSSRNTRSVCTSSSSDSNELSVPGSNENNDLNLVLNENERRPNLSVDSRNSRANLSFNDSWPHSLSRMQALICCSLGLFNITRFTVLTINYGGNFLVQFLLLSIIFGIPFFWLQMSLGAKVKAGPVSMWKISPICSGIGIALVVVQYILSIYSSVVIAWLMIYLGDTLKHQSTYQWLRSSHTLKPSLNMSTSLTECVPEYFNIIVLQRFVKHFDGSAIRFDISNRLSFYLALLWTAVFLILSKGFKSFGKIVFVLCPLSLIALTAVTSKLFCVIDLSSLQSTFSSKEFDDFLINSKTWVAAAQETFLTWGLIGPSVIALSSRTHTDICKSVLRRDAIVVVLVTILGLGMAAMLGLCGVRILSQAGYFYVPGSYEKPESYKSVYSIESPLGSDLFSFPSKLLPHYSCFIGEVYKQPSISNDQESGYQVMRFISELFPAIVTLSGERFSWIWTAIAFGMFFIFGILQLCVMWKPISSALGDSTSSVLLSCVTGLLLSIPFATEGGITLLYYMDLLLGGAWFIPILWAAEIFGVFLIRGRPYNGDDLVNDLKMSGSASAFLALSWNVLLPIGLITLAVINYRTSFSKQFFYWRGQSCFSYWARKVGGLTQIGLLLLVPIVAIIQIYKYLTNGPPDILDRIQLVYRPPNGSTNRRNNNESNITYEQQNQRRNVISHHITQDLQNDAPPKYTPPPSYTTATGARLAKILRQSIRRSVRRIMGNSTSSGPSLSIDSETYNCDCSTNLSERVETINQNINEAIGIEYGPTLNFLDRKHVFRRSYHSEPVQRPPSAPHYLSKTWDSEIELERPYTAQDVVTVLKSSTKIPQQKTPHSGHPNEENSFAICR